MPHAPIEIGSTAPAFSLPNADGKAVSLKDLLGQWLVLYFYPRDNTSGCTKQACEFTSHLKDFERLNATVIGVSPDSPQSHRKFIDKFKLKIDLLSDPEHKALQAYGAWGEKTLYGKKYHGVLRSTVVIDPAGRVAHHWPKVQPAGHAQAVAEKLRDLQHAS